MAATTPHLHFRGNCREAFQFYAATFGGEVVFAMTYGEAPGGKPAPEVSGQIAHARVDLGDQCLLGCDVTGERYAKPQGFNLMAHAAQPEEAERLFNRLADGGSVTMPVQETFWAHRFGICTDRYGTPWMVNCPKPAEAVAVAAGKTPE